MADPDRDNIAKSRYDYLQMSEERSRARGYRTQDDDREGMNHHALLSAGHMSEAGGTSEVRRK